MHNVDQFQKEKDAVKHKLRENQQKLKDELQKQMDSHKSNKDHDKSDDLHYFEVIRRQKEESAIEDIKKRDHIKKLVED